MVPVLSDALHHESLSPPRNPISAGEAEDSSSGSHDRECESKIDVTKSPRPTLPAQPADTTDSSVYIQSCADACLQTRMREPPAMDNRLVVCDLVRLSVLSTVYTSALVSTTIVLTTIPP